MCVFRPVQLRLYPVICVPGKAQPPRQTLAMQALVKAGADLEVKDAKGLTALQISILAGWQNIGGARVRARVCVCQCVCVCVCVCVSV